MTDDLDCRDVAEVRRRVVDPVVAAVLSPGEVQSVEVVVSEPPAPQLLWPQAAESDSASIRAVIMACGETLDVFLGSVSDELWDARETADCFFDRLTEELPETRFAWGELREGRFEVPGRRPSSGTYSSSHGSSNDSRTSGCRRVAKHSRCA